MATPIEHRARYVHGTDEVFAAHTDERALRARLARTGGPHAELPTHETTADGVRYTLVQGIDAAKLPGAVRRVHRGDLVVHREHSWTDHGTGRYTGTVAVHVADLPGRLTADTEITSEGEHSVVCTRGSVAVRLPLVGGRLENVVAEQVTRLLDAEAEFTVQWLAGRS
ncbi:DUF2505 domain-containing protein [Saccharomonospora iraqiensis]|uniref:DUF2505 domain-containing protein n=1 Tax=Saccharomonospora iraqiensis TaxID=52698 RepID=UPI00022E24CE|nr:DUF2505 domain-containing protein [Saccharomonospora iraqiensis]